MSEQKTRHVGIIGAEFFVKKLNIVNDVVPTVFFGEKSELRVVRDAFAVSEVVVCRRNVTVFGEELQKRLVTSAVLGNSVRYLNYSLRFSGRFANSDIDVVLSV